jgi:SAM-dependent methyltransferase
MEATTKYQREAAFHDKVFSDGGRGVADGFYAVAGASKAFYRKYLMEHCKRATVLEYGCGPDSHSMFLVPRGAKVVGVDISPVAIQHYRQVVSEHKLRNVEGCVMNGESLAFRDGSFDLICGLGILHHLNLDSSFRELSRTLKPEGSAVFLEPLGHNPLINAYRKLTPSLRTPDEHPLKAHDLETAARYFGVVETKYFHLTSLLALPVKGSRVFPHVVRWLDAFDQKLFTCFQALRKHAWAVALIMAAPRQEAGLSTCICR